MDFISLYNSAEQCFKNKRNHKDAIDFSINKIYKLSKLTEEINNGEYKQSESIAFIVKYPQPREIIAANFKDRVIETWIDMRIRPIVESIISPNIFNNRKGKGVTAAINKLIEDVYEATNGYKEKAYIIKRDIKAYFPSMNKSYAFYIFKEIVNKYYKKDDKDDILYLAERLLLNNPTNNCKKVSPLQLWELIPNEKSLFKLPPDKGLALGNLLTQLIALIYLYTITNFEYENGFKTASYVDDTGTIVKEKDKNNYLVLLPKIREMHEKIGLNLNEKKFYCQPTNHGFEFLGSIIHHGRIYLKNRTINKCKNKIKKLNKIKHKEKILHKFESTINSYLGLLKNRTEYNNIVKIINLIDDSWWKFFIYDNKKFKINHREYYTDKYLLIKEYNIKLNDKKRKRRANKRLICKDTKL